MNSYGARVGDRVCVCWGGDEVLRGTVKYMPCATGDNWIIWTDEGTIYHVQSYEAIIVLDREADSVENS